jgi:hypothetical protein
MRRSPPRPRRGIRGDIERFEEGLSEVLGEYTDLYRISLVRQPESGPYLRLTIRWDRLLEYLEYRASACIEEARRRDPRGAAEAVGRMYLEDIIGNYAGILAISGDAKALEYLVEHAGMESEHQRLRYRKLLRGLARYRSSAS